VTKTSMSKPEPSQRRLAAMGGSYGNLAALRACLDDATRCGAELRAFLGDAIGCCGHSDAVVALVRDSFDLRVAGNHEQQAVARAETCGCGYSSPEDEEVSCEAFQLATAGLGEPMRAWLGTWPSQATVELAGGRVLLCHGSPGHTSEFLYEFELDDLRLEAWLDHFGVRGFVCTHSGLPWVRQLRGGRFAANCGAVGKPDHDGDPAVHYALLDLPECGEARVEIRRVEYDHEGWARTMEDAGISAVFVEPVRTGIWTTGVASLPAAERSRWLRAHPWSRVSSTGDRAWPPEYLERTAWSETLTGFGRLGLVSAAEIGEALSLLDPAWPFFGAVRLADSVHLHVKVDDVATLPHAAIQGLGTRPENERAGYVKYSFPGGINLIFSSIPIAEEDELEVPRGPKPFVDHFGIDLRRETGVVRAAFQDVPARSLRAGWPIKSQGGPGRPVSCCHSQVAEKYWIYPPAQGVPWTRPVEFAFGPLRITADMNGCDLRPIDPRHPAAVRLNACAVPAGHLIRPVARPPGFASNGVPGLKPSS
jgi:diadenosine tetraphosphatase ApaH/serine/threonine PP2A family protein phosphatase